ncbi:CotH kinase family protein [Flavobacteriales bacterium]|nr:CotH kinase family protein [Flavobacteriales bacterium]
MSHTLVISFILSLTALSTAVGQVKINEACSSNNNIILDFDGDSRDWLELYNEEEAPIDLSGYFLTDSRNDTTKWQIQSGSIPALGHLLIFASGKDRPSGNELHTSFKLSQGGETVRLFDPNLFLVDSISIPFISTDLSYGAVTDGNSVRGYFDLPTPNASNNTSISSNHIIAYAPKFNKPTGVYQQQFSVEVGSNDQGSIIRYSLDGSDPDTTSSVYTAPISVTETIVLKARVYKEGLIASTTTTANFLFLENQTIPIVCLSTDPDYFFDFETGIYVAGPNAEPEFPHYGANYWSDTEVPINVQWIDDYGRLGFDQKLGARIHGGSTSRTRPMRSLRLLADDKYGKDEIEYSIFRNKIQPINKRFLLRNSGSDYLKTMFRDGFIHNVFIDADLHVDAVSYNPVEVYLNGEFWGIHNVREKVDRYYVQYNFGVDDDNIDMLEEQDQVMEGDYIAFDTMEAQLLDQDLTVQSNFQIADSLFDVLNIADYYISQTYINNLDWPYNNLKYWRERVDGAKWRYIIFDLDATLGGVTFAPAEFNSLERALGSFGDDNRHILIFRKLLENENYRQYFINRYCDLTNTAFSPKEFSRAAESAAARIEKVIPKHFDRWSPELNDWEEQVSIVKEYVQERPSHAINQLQAFFNLEKQSNIQLNVYPPQAGRMNLNSISIRNFPFDGVYFEDVPITVGVVENQGFTFSHWETNRADMNGSSAYSRLFFPVEGDTVTAVFTGNSTFTSFDIYPNPASESATAKFVLDKKQLAELYLVDLNGQTKYKLYSENLFSGTHEVKFNLPARLEGVYILVLLTEDERFNKKLVLVQPEG